MSGEKKKNNKESKRERGRNTKGWNKAAEKAQKLGECSERGDRSRKRAGVPRAPKRALTQGVTPQEGRICLTKVLSAATCCKGTPIHASRAARTFV